MPFGKKNLMVSCAKIKAEDWEKLTEEYNEQAAENKFVQRTSSRSTRKKQMKDQPGKSWEGYHADNENSDFPYFEIMDRVLCDKHVKVVQ